MIRSSNNNQSDEGEVRDGGSRGGKTFRLTESPAVAIVELKEKL